MENNKLCNWLLHYSGQSSKMIIYDNKIDVELSVAVRHKLCSSESYFECGKNLFFDFPSNSTGFVVIFEYLSNHKGVVMEKLHDEEQRLYINKLTNSDNFSMRHHVSIIKCFMKIYVCQLAPCERINQALEAIDIASILENVTGFVTFRHTQRFLILWLREAAIVGILKVTDSAKNITNLQAVTIAESSPVGSLLLYAMMAYVQTKLIKYTVRIPCVDSLLFKSESNTDLFLEHSGIVITMFTDICDNKDILPLHMDCLNSRTIDTVPTTLTIALVFHWIIGNSLRKFGNCLQTSVPCTKSDRVVNSHRPNNLSLNNNSNDTIESKSFFISNNNPPNDCLRQLFAKEKEDHIIMNASKTIKSNINGETLSDVYLLSAEPRSASVNSNNTARKVQSYKTPNHILKHVGSVMRQHNLKAEFQKKLKEKQGLTKQCPQSNIIVNNNNNETTWLAQSHKTEIIQLPLAVKKSTKSSDNLTIHGSQQNLSKCQLNQIQMQLSLQRQKIENDKKNNTELTEKKFEISRQQAFFQAIDREKKIVRRRSLEIDKDKVNIDRSEGDKRLSMYIKRTSENVVVSPIRRLESREMLQSFVDVHSNVSDSAVMLVIPCDHTSNNTDNTKTEVSQLPYSSENNVFMDRSRDIPSTEPNIRAIEAPSILSTDETNAVLLNEPQEHVLRKNGSPTISSFSSFSSDKNVPAKEDEKKSFDILGTSDSSLPDEVRMLKIQQMSWRTANDVDNGLNFNKSNKMENFAKSENSSVLENQTNNGISLTEITDLPKYVTDINIDQANNIYHQESIYKITDLISAKCEDSPKECSGPIKSESKLEPVYSISPSSQTSSPRYLIPGDRNVDYCKDISVENSWPQFCGSENNKILTVCSSGSVTENDITYSSESVKIQSVQPSSFIIAEDLSTVEIIGENCIDVAKEEEMRALKMEQFKQKREYDRENRLIAANDKLLERELKKGIEKQKVDHQFINHEEQKSQSPVTVDQKSFYALKSKRKSQTPRTNINNVKQESIENIPLVSSKKNHSSSAIRQSQRTTSNSTSKLNTNIGISPQEYAGPKLFVKQKVKTNRSVIVNAISYCCLAGTVNTAMKDLVLKDLADFDGTHFMILFRDSRCQYKSLYLFDLITEELVFITGNGPKRITHDMVETFFKYNSGTKQFNAISSTKHLSTSVDAISIHSSHWNARLTGQIITSAISSNCINSQIKSKR